MACGKHRRSLRLKALFGAIVNGWNAWQGHDQGQTLTEAQVVTTLQKTVNIMVVNEAGHAMGIAVHLHGLTNSFGQHCGGSAPCHHFIHAAVQSEVQHALKHRFALGIAHIGFYF